MNMRASILNIGTELLVGHVLNTNANYLSKLLNSLGYSVYFHITCGDNYERAIKTLDFLVNESELVVITGGLGPTEDDITREIVAKYLGVEMVSDDFTKKQILDFFAKYNLPLSENNLKQAQYPKGAKILKNLRGTAPGIMIKKDNCTIVCLPGPPHEMEAMAENEMLEILTKTGKSLFSKYVMLTGLGESKIDEIINDIFKGQGDPTIGIYGVSGGVMLRLSTLQDTQEHADGVFDPVVKIINDRLGEYVYSTDGSTLEEVLVRFLERKSLKISTAESLTGGLISQRITSVPGSSNVFGTGFVTYSNDEKINTLGVSRQTIEVDGVVSEKCALEMAKGLYRKTGTDIVIAVTGFAGPTADDDRVGEVYSAFGFGGKFEVVFKKYYGNREYIRRRVCEDAFSKVIKYLKTLE